MYFTIIIDVSYCFFSVSTDFFSISSLAATCFFTLASNSSAPLRGGERERAWLNCCWLFVHFITAACVFSILPVWCSLLLCLGVSDLLLSPLKWSWQRQQHWLDRQKKTEAELESKFPSSLQKCSHLQINKKQSMAIKALFYKFII